MERDLTAATHQVCWMLLDATRRQLHRRLALHAYEKVADARQQLESYFTFYNTLRPHSSLGGQTPDMAYFGNGEMNKAS